MHAPRPSDLSSHAHDGRCTRGPPCWGYASPASKAHRALRGRQAFRREVMRFRTHPTSVVQPRAGVEPWWNTPNVVSVARTVGSVAVGLWAITAQSLVLLVVAYGVYWVGDMLDGH